MTRMSLVFLMLFVFQIAVWVKADDTKRGSWIPLVGAATSAAMAVLLLKPA